MWPRPVQEIKPITQHTDNAYSLKYFHTIVEVTEGRKDFKRRLNLTVSIFLVTWYIFLFKTLSFIIRGATMNFDKRSLCPTVPFNHLLNIRSVSGTVRKYEVRIRLFVVLPYYKFRNSNLVDTSCINEGRYIKTKQIMPIHHYHPCFTRNWF